MTWDPACRLLTIEEAAATVQRPASTIRRWVSEHRLTPVARYGRKTLYLEADVLRVDADTTTRQHRSVRPN